MDLDLHPLTFSDKPILDDPNFQQFVETGEVFGSQEPHTESQHLVKYSDMGLYLVLLYNLAIQSASDQLLELGVRCGVSSRVLCFACKQRNFILNSVDILESQEPKYWMGKYSLTDYWKFFRINDLDFNLMILSLNSHKTPKFGLIFIDTSHEYYHTKKEIELYSPWVVSKGFMVFHDSELPEVSGPINDFLDKSKDFYLVKKIESGPGLTVLRKIA